MFFDPLYLIIMVGTLVVSGAVSMMVKKRFRQAEKVSIRTGLAGHEVAAAILQDAGIHDVRIELHQGFLSDHYNPLSKTLALSPAVYHGRNAAAAGVAAHEVGHALQHAENYFPMWIRSTLVPVANIGNNLGPWLVFLGMILGVAQGFGYSVAVAGVMLFAASTLFTVVTVPVEYDASARAKDRVVRMGLVQYGREQDAIASVLNAAGLTYVAAAASSIAMLFYWAMRAGLLPGGSDD